MLNYNKSFRESQGKNCRKSIYRGNKLHTTSMNLKASYQVTNDNPVIIMKDIENKPQEQRSKYLENPSKSHSKNQRNSIKLQQTTKRTTLSKTKQPYQQSIRMLETDRLNRENNSYRKSIQLLKPKQQRLKTDMNEPLKDIEVKKYSDAEQSPKLKQKQACIQVKLSDLKRLLQSIESLKKQKDTLVEQLNFVIKNVSKSSVTNSALKALRK